jgi:hypothetical protein
MSIFLRSGRYLAAVLAICSTAFLGFASIGWAGTQPLNRQPPGKLLSVSQPALQARIAKLPRNELRRVAQRACASHRQRLCAQSRARLAHDGKAARLRGTAGKRRAHVTPSSPGGQVRSQPGSSSDSGTSPSGPNRSSAGSGTSSSGSGTSPSGSGSPPAIPSAPIAPSPGGGLQPEAPAPASTPSFQPGLDSGTNMTLDLQGSVLLGAKLVRIEFPIDTPAAQMESVIAGYAAKGIRVLLLASFYGRLPTPAEARSLASWAAAYGPGGTFWANRSDGSLAVRSIEFGNETSYGYQYGDGAGSASYRERAENYARRLQEAAEAIATTGTSVGLLAQADDWTGDWMNGMYAAVPDLSDYVGGWVIHPYHHWRGRLEALIAQTAAHGAPARIPIDITEWGLPTDNGSCLGEDEEYNSCMPYKEAAAILRETLGEIRQLLGDRLGMFILYQVRDQASTGASGDGEMYYGALQHELQPKGEYTAAIQTVLASS